MATKTRLDKTINGLTEIVNRNNKQDKFIISNEKIIINSDSSSQLGAILLMSIILLLPLGIILYYINVDNANSNIFWLLLLEILLVYDFYKLLRDNTTLTIDFTGKFIQADNTITTLKKIFSGTSINFSKIENVALKEKAISWQQKWFQLVIFDKDNNAIVLTDFQKSYPESLIAEKVKFLLEVIIWTEKQDIVHVV